MYKIDSNGAKKVRLIASNGDKVVGHHEEVANQGHGGAQLMYP